MAKRPAWTIRNDKIVQTDFEFDELRAAHS